MEQKSSVKTVFAVLGCLLTVVLTVLALVPFLNELLSVEVVTTESPAITEAPRPDKPEAVPVTVYYIMEENSKKISGIYIEVFHVGSCKASYLDVPVDTRVDLSEELYKSLQSYAPELPRYLKLSNMAESFSAEYGLTGCNRILSEVLGVSLTEYIRTDAETFAGWLELQSGEKTDDGFFRAYGEWLAGSSSSRTEEERWMYYESRKIITDVTTEPAPGSQSKDGFLISGKRSRERLEELKLRRE